MSILTLLRRTLPTVACLLMLLDARLVRAATVSYDDFGWDAEWESPGLYTSVGAADVRTGHIDAEDGDINEVSQDSTIELDSTALYSVLAVPPGSSTIPGSDPFSARAQTRFGENHAAVQSIRYYEFDSQSGEFYVEHRNQAEARSSWADEWTFSSFGTVTLDLHWDATFEVDPLCPNLFCGVSLPPGTDSATLQGWFTLFSAGVGVYDLDQLEESDPYDGDPYLIPTLITSILIEQRSGNADALDPIDLDASLSFAPVPGHRYAVGSYLYTSGARGGDIDALNTAFLERIVLAAGQTLSSVAVANLGAQYDIETGVPEPSAAWLLALAGLLFGAQRRLLAN